MQPTIVHNFARHARAYDRHARVQRWSGRELLSLLPVDSPRRILDVGCGTGLYSRMLKEDHPAAHLVGLDATESMLRAARGKTDELVAADAERLPFVERFDLVTSNATLHWLDPERALDACHRALEKSGVLTFSAYGPDTFRELAGMLQRELAAQRFPRAADWRRLLKRRFRQVAVHETRKRLLHASLLDLLQGIKYTGTRGHGVNVHLNRPELERVEALYRERHDGIRATYQVFFCRAVK